MNWKAPPTDETMLHINRSMELQLLLACDWSCQACDQFSNFHGISWVKKATMTLGQIGRFISEMVDHNAYLGRIRLLGGEPTLHPRFAEIVAMLDADLVQTGHVGSLEVITNGGHPTKIEPVKKLVRVRVSGQSAKEANHVANLKYTPDELGYAGIRCNAPEHCGFSLNFFGYFPCSAGAGIARLRDWMHWQRLTLPQSVKDAWPDLQTLCNFCYHGLRDEHKVKCGTDLHQLNVPSQETWGQLAPWLNGKQPEWAIYGS